MPGILLFCVFLLLAPLSLFSQSQSPAAFSAAGIGTGTREIDGNWAFHLGDDPAYAQPAYNDSAWEKIPLDGPWGDHGHPYQTGFAWYRRTVAFTPGTLAPGEKLALYLPELDNIAEVYWNGQLAGSTGHMPPHPGWYFFQRPTSITLPTAAGETSGTLAIRVWKSPLSFSDTADTGGLQSAPLLGSPAAVALNISDWYGHLLVRRFIGCGVILLCALASFFCLIFWSREPRQWVYLCLGGYYLSYFAEMLMFYFPFPIGFYAVQSTGYLLDAMQDSTIWFLLIWLFEMRTRFWIRLTLCLCAVDFITNTMSACNVSLSLRAPALYYSIDRVLTLIEYALPLFIFVLVVAGFRRRPRGPRLVLGLAVAIDVVLQFCDAILKLADAHVALDWLRAPLLSPLLNINGYVMSKFTAAKLLLLLAVCYAVWDYMNVERRRRRAIAAELKSAQEVQQVLVPEELPEIPGYTLSSAYKPAQEVGGDFFQIIPLEGEQAGSTLIVLGDVSGKGLKAAMTVSLIVGAIRTAADTTNSPAEVLSILNRRLTGRMRGGFATCVALRIDPTGHCVLATAGHPAPFLNHSEVHLPGAFPLGLTANTQYEETTLQLAPGDYLALYTDGLLEARSPAGEIFSFERLTELFTTHPNATQATQAAITFGQDDDITVVTLSRSTTLNAAIPSLA